ncbi:MAG TPA: hypothetical protein PKJ99_17575 [Thermoanaerobaculales bacterium]|nr:hypothetical protein [Thermoanaerobaculales bacterium]HQL29764.1 hypothetical protein [Thermoanaerobaculales bacterium]HQN97143.1 hypothetical protein [Thermoanaerobaculales bacterium]
MMGLGTFRCRWSALLVLAAASLAAPALAGDDPAPVAPQEQAVTQAPAAGLVVYIDPETGKVTSTPTDAQRAAMQSALAELLNYSDEGLVEVVMPDGSVVMDLQGRFQSTLIVQVAPDGTRHFTQVGAAPDTIDALPAQPAPAPQAAAAAE